MSFHRLRELYEGGAGRWASSGAALLSAFLLFLGMPGYFGWWPLLFVALVPLLSATLYLPPFRSGCMGMLSGFVSGLLTVHWIVVVLGKYGGLPPWLSVPAMALLALAMGAYTGLFCMLTSLLAGRSWHRERSVATLLWIAPICWVAVEYLRGILFTGFPWMDLGYGLSSVPDLIQAADLGGHLLLSFTLVLANGFVLAVIDRQYPDIRLNIRSERRALFLAAAFLVFIFGYSAVRYRMMPLFCKRGLQVEVSVVQGNISQDVKWSPEKKEETVDIYEHLSRTGANGTTELLVWPETALPFYPQQDPLAWRIMDLVRAENIYLLTGAPTFTVDGNGEEKRVQYYNSALLFGPSGRIRDSYSKQHLVPFGEYVPLSNILSFLGPLVENAGDFSPGTSSGPIRLGRDLRLGILICFESIFAEIARDEVAQGADLLVNLTNDAWYGRSSAPYQSMAMSVLRAVENRRSLVRAANTGISGFVDPAGNILEQSGIFVPAVLTARVPVLTRETVFVRLGYRFGAACLACIPGLLLFRKRQI